MAEKRGPNRGPKGKLKPVEMVPDLPSILRLIQKSDLDTEDAMAIVASLRSRDLIDFGVAKTGPGREKFTAFLSRFWDMEKSPYLRDKVSHGRKITRKYCREAEQKIEKHWEPFLGDEITLAGITRENLRELSIALYNKQGDCIYFFSVIFCAFFAAAPQKTGLSGVPLRSIPSAYASGTLRAPPIPCAPRTFPPFGRLRFAQRK